MDGNPDGAMDKAVDECDRIDALTPTAPRRIWLQINVNEHADARDQPFPPDHDGVSWCDASVGGPEVEYVRADLAGQQSGEVA